MNLGVLKKATLSAMAWVWLLGCEPDYAKTGHSKADRQTLPVVQKMFPRQTRLIEGGLELRDALKSGRPPECLPGDKVIFYGSAAPPGGNADLLIEQGVQVSVQIQSNIDVRPHAVMWTACVRGEVVAVGAANKTVRILANPEDWKVLETW